MTKKNPESSRSTKGFYLRPEFARAFDILAAEQGPRSAPKLIEEAINLLLVKYGKSPIR